MYTCTLSLQGRVHHGRKRRADVWGVWPQPLGSQAQVKVQLEKFHYPQGAKGGLLVPGHHKGCLQATQGAEEKDEWV